MNHSDLSDHSDHGAADVDGVIMQMDESHKHDIMETAMEMHYITSAYIGPGFLLLGLIGNVLSMVIWRKKSMNSSTGVYLFTQAINDIGVLIFFFFTNCLLVIVPDVKNSYTFGVFHAYIGWPMFYFFIINSIWTLVGVTVDRYIQVCWINQSKALCSEKAAQSGVALISILCFILNTPHFVTYYPISDEFRAANQTAYDYTEFGRGSGSKLYEFWVHCMFIVLAPWITIMYMNLAIIRRITAINKQMNQSRGEKAQRRAQRKENQLTKILLTLTFTFLALIALQCITQCFFMLQPKIADMQIVNEAFSVAKLGIVVNSSINFLLYCFTGKRFRKELRLTLYFVFHCKGLVPMPNASDLYSSTNPDSTECSETVSNRGSSVNSIKRIDTPHM